MSQLNILLVDDEADIRRIASLSLERIGGHQVRSTSSGREAISLAQADRPDVVLLDVMMPELDGPATLAELQKVESLTDLRVIFLTAKAHPSEIDEFLALGAHGVISKPFDPLTLSDEVLRTVRT